MTGELPPRVDGVRRCVRRPIRADICLYFNNNQYRPSLMCCFMLNLQIRIMPRCCGKGRLSRLSLGRLKRQPINPINRVGTTRRMFRTWGYSLKSTSGTFAEHAHICRAQCYPWPLPNFIGVFELPFHTRISIVHSRALDRIVSRA